VAQQHRHCEPAKQARQSIFLDNGEKNELFRPARNDGLGRPKPGANL
jgi:hypothetical protein